MRQDVPLDVDAGRHLDEGKAGADARSSGCAACCAGIPGGTILTKPAPSLDAKIAAALAADGNADRAALVDLIRDAPAAIELAQTTIATEQPRLLDIDNLDPDTTRQLINSARLRIDRLSLAIPRLQERVAVIDHETALAAWTAQANALRDKSDALYREHEAVYPPIVAQLNALFLKGRANAAAFADLARRAPPGAFTDFSPAVPWDGFWLRVQLPDWSDSRITHPPRVKPPDPQVEIALMQAAFAKQLDAKMLISVEQQREIDAKREEEMKQKAHEEREKYHQDLLAAERRRATGG